MNAIPIIAAGLTLAAIAAPSRAQTLASRVDAVKNGTLVFTYAARPGVCGDGGASISFSRRDRDDDNGWRCMEGPVRVTLVRSDGETIRLRARVALRHADSAATDLGTVPPQDAAHYLLDVARHADGRVASEAVTAAALADVEDMGALLLPIVRDEHAPLEARKGALFWAGQTELPTKDLLTAGNALQARELREQYVFVLSQRHDDAAVAALITLARSDPDATVRKRAMFWLGQSRDPKAVQFFHDVLTR